MAKILIVEDDRAILLGLRANLAFEGHSVVEVQRGDEALERLAEAKPDLLILDVMLPGRNGFEICREIRSSDRRLPILMLTARSQDIDKVMGLDLGADDYLTKPFSLPELLARVRALLRRTQAAGQPLLQTLEFGGVLLDFVRQTAARNGEPVHLTTKEFALIQYLATYQGEAIRRDVLLDRVWGAEVYVTNRTVDTHISALRSKLEPDPPHPRYLLTVHGIGYKFAGDT